MGGCQPTRLQRGRNLISTESQAPQTKNCEIDKTAERPKPRLHRVASAADKGDLKIRERSAFTSVQNLRHRASINADARAKTLGLNSCRCHKKKAIWKIASAPSPQGPTEIRLRPQVVYLRKLPQRPPARMSVVLIHSGHGRGNDPKPGLSGSGYVELALRPACRTQSIHAGPARDFLQASQQLVRSQHRHRGLLGPSPSGLVVRLREVAPKVAA